MPAARYIQSNPPRAKGGWSPYVVTIDQDEPTRVALVPPSRGGGQHDDGRVYLRAIVLFAEAALLLSSKATHDPLEGGELMDHGWMGSKLALSVTAQANVSVAWRVRGSISSGVGGGGGGGHERMHRACAQVLLLLLATVRGSAADCRRAPCVDSATWMYIIGLRVHVSQYRTVPRICTRFECII